ncbi:tryptophan-rich sensory protein [Candidatus Pacearchaeota archaeon]|nr:tryptophan-rich sensory protein [Candidatus Pacearchaeota archaeon]
MKIRWKILALSFVIVFGVAFLGSLFTTPVTNSEWYESIKPAITPPNYVFPIVWNILFLLITISIYLSWTSAKKKQKTKLAWAFGINLFLNALWSLIFFTMKNPPLAFFELILLDISIFFLIYTTNKIDKTSSYLLIPYFLWVTFAGYLNYLMAF